MCGIIAIAGTPHCVHQRTQDGLAAIHHRGPDDSSIWINQQQSVALGHRRLAARGNGRYVQPICNERGDIVITVNGEFYDYASTRKRLEELGHVFSTNSDSEIALHLYEVYGLGFVAKLRGEFSLILWDQKKQRLVAARDQFGVNPLVYTKCNNAFVVASEAKAIFATGLLTPEWDHASAAHSLAHQYLPTDKTLFRGIASVPPAHMLVVDGMNSVPKLMSYWSPCFTEEPVSPESILEVLKDAISVRLESNHPPAFTLSGGLDSSAIVALSAEKLGRRVPAYTVSFTDSSTYDECTLVRSTAEEIGADLHVVQVSHLDTIATLSDAVYYSEGFAINGQIVAKYMLNRAIRAAGHNVVLTGEGADEAFLGYAHLQLDYGNINSLDLFNRQKGIMLPNDFTSARIAPAWLGKWPTFLLAKMEYAKHYAAFVDPEFLTTDDPSVDLWLAQLFASREFNSMQPFVRKSAWLWTRSALSSYILRTLADGTEMAHSIEGRLPFLDQELFALASKLTPDSNLNDRGSKQILRESLRSVLPESICKRVKHPFIAPPLLGDNCLSAVIDYISDTLRSSSFASVPFFDQKKTIQWFDSKLTATAEERKQADPAIMTLLSFAAMQERYKL
jgi:asparagine synthase (glutamine-hydrolysing)